VHFFSHNFFSPLAAQASMTIETAGTQLGWQLPPTDPDVLAASWVHELDRQGVFASVLIASIPGDEGSVIAAARAFPQRFFAYAMVNPRALTAGLPAAFSEVRAACLFPAMHGYSIQDECAKPVFEWAQTDRRAIFVHCGVLSVGVRKKLGLPSPFDMRYSNPVDLHSIALRYPDVPIVVPHFGAGYFREALMLADQCANVYLDTSSSNHWMRYQPGHVTLREVFRHALDVTGPKRLLFGTDSSFFPRGWHHAIFEDQARALYEIGTSEADAHAIFGENLLRILAA